jgi:hypothetical protein
MSIKVGDKRDICLCSIEQGKKYRKLRRNGRFALEFTFVGLTRFLEICSYKKHFFLPAAGNRVCEKTLFIRTKAIFKCVSPVCKNI